METQTYASLPPLSDSNKGSLKLKSALVLITDFFKRASRGGRVFDVEPLLWEDIDVAGTGVAATAAIAAICYRK